MEISLVSNNAQKLWDTWDIRVCVLVSLFVQGLLFFSASNRKHTTKKAVVTLVSSAYFLADWVAPYALGLISNRQVSSNYLFPFWASFLLLHLGGPYNVTSLSPDENEMRAKHWVQLISRTLTVALILVRSLHKNTLLLPTILVFLAGFIRCIERVLALNLASSKRWKNSTATEMEPNPGSDYEKLSGVHLAMREAHLPMEERSVQAPLKKFKSSLHSVADLDFESELDGVSLMKFAHCFYENFKGFIGGVSFSPEQRQFTRDFFLKIRTGHNAFKLLEMELSFIYEALHTKAAVSNSLTGACFALVSLGSVIGAWLLFINDKHHFSTIDTIITYFLVSGALFFECFAAIIGSGSDWYLMMLTKNRDRSRFCHYCGIFILRRRRWSETVSKCNLISYCLYGTPEVNKKLTNPTIKYVEDVIFDELIAKSKIAKDVETATKICSQRGDWALMRSSCYSELKWSLGEVEYGKSLLLWHIATDLCYYISTSGGGDNKQGFCKTISDYMLYLLLVKPTMMDPVAGNWLQIFRDTSAEVKRLFHKRSIKNQQQACQAILSVNTEIKPDVLKGDASKSVLFDACRLAKQLMEKEEPWRWKLMSQVWMELLAYAAVNCEATVHAQQPGQGGELLTFVWLLMNHLGFSKQFRDEPARTRCKLVVKK